MTLLPNESPNSPPEVYAFDGYSIFKRDDHIIQIQFEPGFNITEKDARHYMSVVKKIKEAGKCKILVIFGENSSFSKETREHMSCDETFEIMAATAIVMRGIALKILIDGYVNINKPKHHVKTFENSQKAVEWLLQLN